MEQHKRGLISRVRRAGEAAWCVLMGKTFLNLPDDHRAMAAADLDDASLVKWARWALANAARFYAADAKRKDRDITEVTVMHGVIALARMTLAANATHAEFSVSGITYRDQEVGDWQVTIARTDAVRLTQSTEDHRG